jgi:hypothetical protein
MSKSKKGTSHCTKGTNRLNVLFTMVPYFLRSYPRSFFLFPFPARDAVGYIIPFVQFSEFEKPS